MARPKSGGGGGGGGRAARPGQDRETAISKAASWLLRHGAVREGVRVDEAGWVNVGDLLSWPRISSLAVTFPELQSIVRTNAKQRFALTPLSSLPNPTSSSSSSTTTTTTAAATAAAAPFPDPLNPFHYQIRATQGHSLPIASENLLAPIRPTDADCPDQVVHGTNDAAWKLIRSSGGLKPMGRRHVHFALGLPAEMEQSAPRKGHEGKTAEEIIPDDAVSPSPPPPASTSAPEPVVSGIRASASVLIWVNVKRSLDAGALTWWRSANGVVLTEGDADGRVGLEWVDRVERRRGGVIWNGEITGGGGG